MDDLKRFREYEASTSRTFGVAVTTCVICSANKKHILSSFKEGLNTYQVKIIRMKDSNADEIFENIKQKKGLSQDDLIPILLSPLMGGTITIKDRILKGIHLIRKEQKCISREEANKMQAVLYAFASKFLKENEMEEVEEEILMTELGQMLMEHGARKKMKEQVEKKIKKGKTIAQIAEELEEDEMTIQEIIDEMK